MLSRLIATATMLAPLALAADLPRPALDFTLAMTSGAHRSPHAGTLAHATETRSS